MIKVLFIGDIVGKIGRKTVKKILPKLKKENKIDLVIANGENVAHGTGLTESTVKELKSFGVDYITSGDHAFKRIKQQAILEDERVLRPANFPPGLPGKGCTVIDVNGFNIVLINLIGRVFMKGDYDCPFRKIDEILANINLPENIKFAIITDIHAEATSEKKVIGYYLNGRAAAVLGTHTHVMTADSEVTKEGTAYISDIGMVGAKDSSLGTEYAGILKTFLTQIKQQHIIPEKGKGLFNAVEIEISKKTGKAKNIKPIIKIVNIK